MDATFSKLNTGAWGIRVTGGAVAEGERVTVTKRSGEQSVVPVTRVIWTDGNTSLCAIGPSERSGGSTRRSRGRRSRTAYERGDRSEGAIASHYDPYNAYSVDGQKIGSCCGCEDYPCCGH